MRDIGKNIRELRQSANMTQDELAEKLFVTRQTVSNYETGKSRPDIEMLDQIARVLNTDVNMVLYGIPQRESRRRKIIKLCVYVAVFGVIWLLFRSVFHWVTLIRNTTYDLSGYMLCVILGIPAIAFMFGWLALQALSTFVKFSPVPEVWQRRLRWAVIAVVVVYLVCMLPTLITAVCKISIDNYISRFLWRAFGSVFYWLSGYTSGMQVSPATVIFCILGSAFWLGTGKKNSE